MLPLRKRARSHAARSRRPAAPPCAHVAARRTHLQPQLVAGASVEHTPIVCVAIHSLYRGLHKGRHAGGSRGSRRFAQGATSAAAGQPLHKHRDSWPAGHDAFNAGYRGAMHAVRTSVAKKPTASRPHAPHAKCTGVASTGSSTRSLRMTKGNGRRRCRKVSQTALLPWRRSLTAGASVPCPPPNSPLRLPSPAPPSPPSLHATGTRTSRAGG